MWVDVLAKFAVQFLGDEYLKAAGILLKFSQKCFLLDRLQALMCSFVHKNCS